MPKILVSRDTDLAVALNNNEPDTVSHAIAEHECVAHPRPGRHLNDPEHLVSRPVDVEPVRCRLCKQLPDGVPRLVGSVVPLDRPLPEAQSVSVPPGPASGQTRGGTRYGHRSG